MWICVCNDMSILILLQQKCAGIIPNVLDRLQNSFPAGLLKIVAKQLEFIVSDTER